MNELKKYIIRSAAVDRHGELVALENLQQVQETINGLEKMRMLLNHRPELPPIGYWDNAELGKEKNMDVVRASIIKYNPPEPIEGTEFFIRRFSAPVKLISKTRTPERTTVSWDRANFKTASDYESIKRQVSSTAPHEVDFELHMRKSVITSPEFIVSLIFAQPFIQGIMKRLGEKAVDNIGDDTYKAAKKQLKLFVAWVKKLHSQTRSHAIPKNKTLVSVFQIAGDPYIELIARTDDADLLAQGFSTANLQYVGETVSNLSRLFRIAECRFLLTDKGRWKLCYMLTVDGYAIGAKQIFAEQEKLAQKIEASPNAGFSIGGYDAKYREME